VDAVTRLVSRDATRTESDLQADIYALLVHGGLSLRADQVARLEVQLADGSRRRIDVEIGHCVIEVKKDLRITGVLESARAQLATYVAAQSEKLESRYVGILTDGTSWHLYRLVATELVEVTVLELTGASQDAERLQVWLESILATQHMVAPVPTEIRRRLGADSPAHLLDHATLTTLYESASSTPEVQVKRDLWTTLLRTAFGTSFTNDSRLFIDHTLLVLTAEIVAHAVIGFDVSVTGGLTPAALTRGTAFASSEIYGVVEADFFDWVIDVPNGPEFVSELAARIARFDWSSVEHDVLKVLYESIIESKARASLGEYYTPDWLAERMVHVSEGGPDAKLLDPSCGSGTFLFHAVRQQLRQAEESGSTNGESVAKVVQQVFGMDIHPVAVTLARVTYLLAIGRERLSAQDRGPISIPVYLGDSLQWEQRHDLLSQEDKVTVSTAGDDLVAGGGGALFGDDLVFPRSVLHDARNFDRLVSEMADKARMTSNRASADLIAPVLRRFGIHPEDVAELTRTFDTMRRLHASGRDHIWGYYVRNLIRPIWLAEAEHRVDILIGNPPWLRYSKMTKSMQQRYKLLASERGLLSGSLGASGRDLSTLFVTRSVELYLKPGGKFAFVMPHGTLTRKPHTGFRSGKWSSKAAGSLAVSFDEAWDLAAINTGFPMVSCVVRGERSRSAKAIPPTVSVWQGRLPSADLSWAQVAGRMRTERSTLSVLSADAAPNPSPYKRLFRQGAVLAPRALLFVEPRDAGPLGAGPGRLAVKSRRTTSEKHPWKSVPSLSGSVERAFVRSVHLGETLLPYRLLDPLLTVLPVTDEGILSQAEIEDHPALLAWWSTAEGTWARHKSSADSSALLDRIDYHGQLKAQLPAAAHRVLYTASGNTLAAARLEDPRQLVEHKLYWAPVSSISEARYLTAILNSAVLLERVRPLQALGLFGPRDFDKNVFSVQIPIYDAAEASHQELVRLAAEAELVSAGVEAGPGADFKTLRKLARLQLDDKGLSDRIDRTVQRVIPPQGPVGVESTGSRDVRSW
jgi:hypothetical protein